MPGTAAANPILSAPRFYMQATGGQQGWGFSELTSINLEVEAHEFIYCDSVGAIQHTKQYGKTKPPEVQLKKAMDNDQSLWMWHQAVQAGNLAAKMDVTLTVHRAGAPGFTPTKETEMFQWILQGAWPKKLDVTGMKAGSGEAGVLTATFTCDYISVSVNGKAVTAQPTGNAF